MTKAEKEKFVAIIAEAIANGDDLRALREAHGVSYQAWQRIVRAVKDGSAIAPETKKKRSKAKPQKPKEVVARQGEIIEANAKAIVAGVADRRTIDEPVSFMQHFNHVIGICVEMEREARDEEGRVKDDKGLFWLNEAAKRRTSAMTMLLGAQEKLWVGHRFDLRQRAIIAAVEMADPETKARIAENFKRIDSAFGVSFDGC